MENTTSEVLISRLLDWGVDTVFAPVGDRVGDHIDGLRRHADRIRLVQGQHAEAAALMATAYAKTTGRLGVCAATSVPSAIGLATGLYDAKLDHAPVLAVTGGPATAAHGTGCPRDVDLTRLYQDVAGHNQAVVNPRQLPALLDRAVRHARAGPDVAHLCLPEDIARAPAAPVASAPPVEGWAPAGLPVEALTPAGVGHCVGDTYDTYDTDDTGSADSADSADSAGRCGLPVAAAAPDIPKPADVARAADIIAGSRRPAILAGAGARGAGPLVERLADTIAAPVVKTLPGRSVLPDDSPLVVGTIGPLGTGPGRELMDDIDTLLMLGTDFPYPGRLPEPGKVRVIQVERDPARAGARTPVELPVIGDVGRTVEALLPLLPRRANRTHLRRYQELTRGWRAGARAVAGSGHDGAIGPGQLLGVLDDLAAQDAVLCPDPGPVAGWAARYWTIRATRECHLSANLSVDGSALPYAVAAQHAWPGRQVIAYLDAGAFTRLMGEFRTACRHSLPVKVVVSDGADGPDLSRWAEACGGYGVRVRRAAGLRAALTDVLAYRGPALMDVAVAAGADDGSAGVDAGAGTGGEAGDDELVEADLMGPHLTLRFAGRIGHLLAD